MTIHIELSPDEERVLREQALRSGRDPAQHAREILRERLSLRDDPGTVIEDMIDHEFVAYCEREVGELENIPTIEEVRAILAKIPGSMAQAIIDDREDRF